MITDAKNKAIENKPEPQPGVSYFYPQAGRTFTGVDKEDCDAQAESFLAARTVETK